MPDLRRLRYFLAVASERNFTRAAARLGIAQPALSRQVRQLEDELGVELLERTTHSFELTEAGAFLLARGGDLMDAADELWRATSSFGTGELGSVVLGYGTSAGYETVPRLLQALAEIAPPPRIDARVLPTGEILEGVSNGTIDLGVVRCPPGAGGLVSWLLRLEQQGVLLRRDDARAAAASVSLDELGDLRLLLHPREANAGHYDAVVDLFRERGLEPSIVHRTLALDLAQTPVLAGEAMTIVGESSRAGLPGELTWIPLTPAAFLETRLVARVFGRPPALERVLSAAVEVADALGWRSRDAGPL